MLMPFETDLKIAPMFSTCRTQYQQNDTKNPTTVFLDMALARSPTNPSIIVTASVRGAKIDTGNEHPPIVIYPSKTRISVTVQISESTIRNTAIIRYGKGRMVIIVSIPPSCSGFSSGTNIGSPISATIRSRQSADFTLSRLVVPYIRGITNSSRIAGKSVCLKFRRKFEPMIVSRFLAPKRQPPFPLHAIHKDSQPNKRKSGNGNCNPIHRQHLNILHHPPVAF